MPQSNQACTSGLSAGHVRVTHLTARAQGEMGLTTANRGADIFYRNYFQTNLPKPLALCIAQCFTITNN
jgi:hypothetical protein